MTYPLNNPLFTQASLPGVIFLYSFEPSEAQLRNYSENLEIMCYFQNVHILQIAH